MENQWSDLPVDNLNAIAERLFYVDQIRFRLVCKSWRSNTNPIKHALDKLPWVMTIEDYGNGYCFDHSFRNGNCISCNSSSFFNLYDPSQKQKYALQNHILVGAKVHASKHGWLLLSSKTHRSMGPSSIFTFYTPFTHQIIQLPKLYVTDGCNEATFSAAPTSPDCMIFVLTVRYKEFYVSTCSPGDNEWRHFWFDGSYEKVDSVAFVGGDFYCLFSNEVMGSFNVEQKNWKILPYPFPRKIVDRNILIESHDGNLLLLAVRHKSHYLLPKLPKLRQIFRFDQSKMKWLEVENLGNIMLFVGVTSMLLPAVEEASELANTTHLGLPRSTWIEFPGLKRSFSGIYSSKFHETRNRLQTYDWIGKEDLKKIWIQPLKHT